MDFQLKTLDTARAANEKADALVVLVPDNHAAAAGPVLADAIAAARKAGDLETKVGKQLALYRPVGMAAARVVLVGAGDGSAGAVRQAVGTAVAGFKSLSSVRRIAILLPEGLAQPGAAVRAAVNAAADASYVYTTTKSKAEGRRIERVLVGVADADAVREDFAHAQAQVAGVEFAKEWGNRPANFATPTLLGDAAKTLGKLARVKVEVLGPREVAKLGMGSFMSVAQGSQEELRFIVLRYDGGPKGEAPVVLVGKGITFDTGGISIKPAGEMDEMKFDMCGAASVLGTFRALGELQPAINVVGLIPAAENMPDGRALKPGDVVTSMSGQTIEVLNTDAEGRLVLCDALTYAERFNPRAVVDIATLTGACVIALGAVRSGLFSSDEQLAADLQAAGDTALDLCWRMPLDDEYAEGLKTNFADVANVAGRAGGAITAAKFLHRFAKKYPWAHLDIAGSAWKGGQAKGSTGRPVGLLLQYVVSQVGKASAAPKAPAKPARKAAAKAAVPAKKAARTVKPAA
ncbi:leucyl aminopeptidase [Xylophilus rhododendri]|uniref:Probable cytosol aminopeptidase n=1 Tax=Xylophilus rhododendri TaxID=2697032 RepID=A0A857IZ33_9BURK|nr:leucyl aminopeptidase [Xylophilus rhododendri]QHI96557.1 leucyl aminopeptidase [Xylophilus rhododendri]